MKIITVRFHMVTNDVNQSFNATGELKNNRIKFTDTDNNDNYLILKEDTIEYYKKGNVDMKYLFQENMKTKGYYKILNSTLIFDIFTKSLIVKDKEIRIEYQLYQEDELINEAELTISYFLEEE